MSWYWILAIILYGCGFIGGFVWGFIRVPALQENTSVMEDPLVSLITVIGYGLLWPIVGFWNLGRRHYLKS